MVRHKEGKVMMALTATVATIRVMTSLAQLQKSSTHNWYRRWNISEFGGEIICLPSTLMIIVTIVFCVVKCAKHGTRHVTRCHNGMPEGSSILFLSQSPPCSQNLLPVPNGTHSPMEHTSSLHTEHSSISKISSILNLLVHTTCSHQNLALSRYWLLSFYNSGIGPGGCIKWLCVSYCPF